MGDPPDQKKNSTSNSGTEASVFGDLKENPRIYQRFGWRYERGPEEIILDFP
jgi:hypothetical protein